MHFAVLDDHRVKIKENEKRDKYQDPARELKNMERKSDGDASCGWCTRNNSQMIGEGNGRLENKRTSRDHPNYSNFKIGQNTEESPGDLRRLAVTQTLVSYYQLTLV